MAINQITGLRSYPPPPVPPPDEEEMKARISTMPELLQGNTVQVPTMRDLLGPIPRVQDKPAPVPPTMPKTKFAEPYKGVGQTGYEALPPTGQMIGRGVMKGVSDVVNPMMTKQGAAGLAGLAGLAAVTAGTGLIPEVVIGLMKVGFTIQGVHDLAMKLPEAQRQFSAGDNEGGIATLTAAVPSLAMVLPGATITPKEFAAPGEAVAAGARQVGEFGKQFEGGFGGQLFPAESGVLAIDYFRRGVPAAKVKIQGREVVPGSKQGTITPEGIAPNADAAVITVDQLPALGQAKSELGKMLTLLEESGVNLHRPGSVILKDATSGESRPLTFAEMSKIYAFPQGKGLAGPQIPEGVTPTAQGEFFRQAKTAQRSLKEGRPPKPKKMEEATPLVEPQPATQPPVATPAPQAAAPGAEFDIFQHIGSIPGLTVNQRLELIQSYLKTTGQAAEAAPMAAATTVPKPVVTPPKPAPVAKPIAATPPKPVAEPTPVPVPEAKPSLSALAPEEKVSFEKGVKALLEKGDEDVMAELQSLIDGTHPNPAEFITRAVEMGKSGPVVEGAPAIPKPPGEVPYTGPASEVTANWRKGVRKYKDPVTKGTNVPIPTTEAELDAFLTARNAPGSKLDNLELVGYGDVVGKAKGTNMYSVIDNKGNESLVSSKDILWGTSSGKGSLRVKMAREERWRDLVTLRVNNWMKDANITPPGYAPAGGMVERVKVINLTNKEVGDLITSLEKRAKTGDTAAAEELRIVKANRNEFGGLTKYEVVLTKDAARITAQHKGPQGIGSGTGKATEEKMLREVGASGYEGKPSAKGDDVYQDTYVEPENYNLEEPMPLAPAEKALNIAGSSKYKESSALTSLKESRNLLRQWQKDPSTINKAKLQEMAKDPEIARMLLDSGIEMPTDFSKVKLPASLQYYKPGNRIFELYPSEVEARGGPLVPGGSGKTPSKAIHPQTAAAEKATAERMATGKGPGTPFQHSDVLSQGTSASPKKPASSWSEIPPERMSRAQLQSLIDSYKKQAAEAYLQYRSMKRIPKPTTEGKMGPKYTSTEAPHLLTKSKNLEARAAELEKQLGRAGKEPLATSPAGTKPGKAEAKAPAFTLRRPAQATRTRGPYTPQAGQHAEILRALKEAQAELTRLEAWEKKLGFNIKKTDDIRNRVGSLQFKLSRSTGGPDIIRKPSPKLSGTAAVEPTPPPGSAKVTEKPETKGFSTTLAPASKTALTRNNVIRKALDELPFQDQLTVENGLTAFRKGLVGQDDIGLELDLAEGLQAVRDGTYKGNPKTLLDSLHKAGKQYEKLGKMEEMGLDAWLDALEGSSKPKTSDLTTMSPTQIRAWGEGQVRGAKLRGKSERREARREDTAAILSESQRNVLRGYKEQLKGLEAIEKQVGPTKAGDKLRRQIHALESGISEIPPPPMK